MNNILKKSLCFQAQTKFKSTRKYKGMSTDDTSSLDYMTDSWSCIGND